MNQHVFDISIALDRPYRRYNRRERIPPDPLQFVYRYSNPADMEITAFLASALAYSRVRHIERSLTILLERMGESPLEFVMSFDRNKRRRLKDFRHRFTSGEYISDLITLFQVVLDDGEQILDAFRQTRDEIRAFVETLPKSIMTGANTK